ncbi:MAG: hypothetical protein AB7V14_05900 [Kiritimatiellia bacterium]
MKRNLVFLLVCCAAGFAGAGDEATPEDIARYNEWRQKKQALANLDEYARAAVALDTNAARCASAQCDRSNRTACFPSPVGSSGHANADPVMPHAIGVHRRIGQ